MLHPEICECGPSGTDLFSRPAVQTSVVQRTIVDCLPVSDVSELSPLEFFVPPSEDVYSLSEHRLEVSIKVTKADGKSLAAADKVSLANFALHSLFSQCDVYVNEQLASPSSNTYAYRAYIESMLTYSSAAKKSQLALTLYSRDNEKMDATDGSNVGAAARAKGIAESRILVMRGVLHNEFLRQERYLISQCSLRIRLTPHNQNFPLLAADGDAFKLAITAARFEIPKLKLNPTEALEIERQLKTTPAKYPIRQGLIKSFSLAAGTMAVTKENIFTSVPRRIIIGLVTAATFNGEAKSNPFNFQHFDLNYLAVYVDGERVPGRPLTPDFTAGSFARSYDLLLQATGHFDDPDGLDIIPEQYDSGYTLFGIPLTFGDPESVAFEPHRQASIRLELKFKVGLPSSVVCLVYGDMQNVIELDTNRVMTFEF